jgi:hypothetical protein
VPPESGHRVVVTGSLLVSETAAFMIDWSSFLDDISFQDPEVATARGHLSVPFPGALPSAVPFAAAAALVQGPAVRRVWSSVGSLEAGGGLRTTVTASPNAVRTRFEAGGFEADELLEVAPLGELASADPRLDARPAFRTSAPVSRTRTRAFAWGLNDLFPAAHEARFERWGHEAPHVALLTTTVLLPTVLAVHVLGVRASPGQPSLRVETLARVVPAPPVVRFCVHRLAAGRAAVVADGVVVAIVTVGTPVA